jgi:small subunit ribosomal protein S12
MVPTINQLCKKSRNRRSLRLYHLLALEGCPQKKGFCVRIRTTKPKKPNSAIRKIARIKLTSNSKMITAYIPGQGHSLQKYSVVLVRGGRVKDLPGIKYKIIRGKFDLGIVESFLRVNNRSKYGIDKEEGLRRTQAIKKALEEEKKK